MTFPVATPKRPNVNDVALAKSPTTSAPALNSSPGKVSPLREWLAVSAVGAVLVILFFYPALFQGKLLCCDLDLISFILPRRYVVTQAIRNGEFPQWEPLIGAGATVEAEGQAGLFYPTNTPLNLLCTPTLASNLAVCFAFYVAFIGSYWLTRVYKVHPLSAIIAALAYAFGATFIVRTCHIHFISALAWLPFALAALHLFLTQGRKVWLIVVGIAWTMQLLAGHPQVVYICQLACWVYIAGMLILCHRESIKPSGELLHIRGIFNLSRIWKSVSLLALAAALSLLISSAQWLPTLEAVQLSSRGTQTSEGVLRVGSFRPHNLLSLVYPYSSGNPLVLAADTDEAGITVPQLYWGILPLLLIFLAWQPATKRLVLLFGILTVLGYLLALGPKSLVFRWCAGLLPMFANFREPYRCLMPVPAFVAVLIALGAQYVFSASKRYSRTLAYGVLGTIFLVTIGDLALVNKHYSAFLDLRLDTPPATLQLLGPDRQRVFSPLANSRIIALEAESGLLNQAPALRHTLLEFPADISAIWGVASLADHAFIGRGVDNAAYSELYTFLAVNTTRADGRDPRLGAIFDILRALNVSHIVCHRPLIAENNPQVAKYLTYAPPDDPQKPIFIYQLAHPLPEVRLVNKLKLGPSRQFTSAPYPLALDDTTGLYEIDLEHPQTLGSCTVVNSTRNTLEVHTEYAGQSLMILSRAYHPNWQAQVDAGPWTPILRVDCALQGVAVPPGAHTVKLRYVSPAWEWGWRLSLAGLALGIVLAGLAIRGDKASQQAE